MGFGETAAGFGLLVGPMIGGSLYVVFGYFWCYILLAAFLMFSLLFVLVVMPNSINKSEDAEKEGGEENEFKQLNTLEENASKQVSKEVGYSWFLTNRRSCFALVSLGMIMIFVSFKQAFMTVVLET